MSRTRHDERDEKRGNGKEWWGKRPLAGHPVSTRPHTNKWWKRLLHKRERRIGTVELTKAQRAVVDDLMTR